VKKGKRRGAASDGPFIARSWKLEDSFVFDSPVILQFHDNGISS
jgi:hypothetical protein